MMQTVKGCPAVSGVLTRSQTSKWSLTIVWLKGTCNGKCCVHTQCQYLHDGSLSDVQCLSRNHPLRHLKIPREQRTWVISYPSEHHKAAFMYLYCKVLPQCIMNILQSYCLFSSSEISSDNESALVGGKVDPLWPLRTVITCKTVLIPVSAQ